MSPASDPATRFDRLDEEQVCDQTDRNSFSRGRSYFRNGHILNPTLRGDTIEAQCLGSEPSPYRVTATLAPIGQCRDNPVRYY